MVCDLNNASTIRAVDMARTIPLDFFSILKRIGFVILIVALLVFSFYSLTDLLGPKFIESIFPTGLYKINRDLVLGISYISFSIWAFSLVILAFVNQKLMRLGNRLGKAIDANVNLAEYLDFRAARLFKKTQALDHLPLEKILLYYILTWDDLAFAMQRLSVSKNDLKAKLLDGMKASAKVFSREDAARMSAENKKALQNILLAAAQVAINNGGDKITIFDIFLVISDTNENFQKVMDELELLKEDVESVVVWQMRLENYRRFRGRFWERDNMRILFATSPVQELIGGFTITLDQYAHDLTVSNPLRQGGVVLHSKEIAQLEEALVKEKGNGIVLVGEPGSGRKSIIYNFANRVASESAPGALKFLRILEIDMVALIAAFPDKAMLAGTLKQVFGEAIKAKNVVLVLPQMHNYIGQHSGNGVADIDISGVISEFLSRPGFRLIGVVTFEGLHKYVDQVNEISARFRKIDVARVSPEDAMRVLKEESLRREKKSRIFVPITSLKEIVKLCDYFLADAEFPAKATNLLDDLIANKDNNSDNRKKIITPEEVDTFFSRKYDVPAGAAGKKEKEVLLNLEERIHEGLINQKEAVEELANALRRCRAEVKKRKRTIGNFLFLGPTGVGKTETAKQLARAYFGSTKNLIRLDMSEYQTVESIDKLIGNGQTPGYLTTAVREMPFSLVLIDEIEKAHSGLLNIFLSVFDEGQMNDGAGRAVDFRHTIIIATSNAGAEYIKEAIDRGSTLSNLRDSFVDNILRRNLFKPEFINRFDSLVLFRPLDAAEMQQVAALMLAEIRDGLKEKRIDFIVTGQLTEKLSQLGFDPAFGGRAMRRIIQNKVENTLAKAILSGRVKSGDTCEFNLETWELLVGDEINAHHVDQSVAGDPDDPMVPLLMSLEDKIHEGLINQKEAVAELANALRRAHANLKKAKRTVGNFLFLGPTGCGKTETAKQLARVFFGSPKNMIRLNMAEYLTAESVDKLIGNLETPGLLTTQMIERPESLVLIDEIEKASPKILNLFLSVFDDGELFDGMGRAIDFKKAIIIATSNAGAELIKEAVDKEIPLDIDFKKTFVDNLLRSGVFSPEFINRFDATVLYRPLGSDEMKLVAGLILKDIQDGLAAKGIEFRVSDRLVTKLVQIGFNPVFGGRSMRRTVQDKVENAIVRALLSRAIQKGDVVEIDPDTWEAVVVGSVEGS